MSTFVCIPGGDAAHLEYFFFSFLVFCIRCSRCSSGWVRSGLSSRPQGTAAMSDWDTHKTAWLRSLCLGLSSFVPLFCASKLQKRKKEKTGPFPLTVATENSVAWEANVRRLTFRVQCLWALARAYFKVRESKRDLVAVCMNKQRFVTAVPPHRKWAESCNSRSVCSVGGRRTSLSKGGEVISAWFISHPAFKIGLKHLVQSSRQNREIAHTAKSERPQSLSLQPCFALSFGKNTTESWHPLIFSSLCFSFGQLSGRLLLVFCVLRRVHGGRLRHSPPAGVRGSAGLDVCLCQQIQRAVHGLPLAAHGEIPLWERKL